MKRTLADDLAELAERLLQLRRLAYTSLPNEPNLTRPQWAALRYFAQANDYSRTATAFGSFYAVTPGTVSETINVLVRRKFLRRYRLKTDRRVVRLDLTKRGWEALGNDPSRVLDRAAEELGAEQTAALVETLTVLASNVAKRQQRPAFGVCHRCKHFDLEWTAVDGLPREGCRLLKIRLSDDNAGAWCVRFESRDVASKSTGRYAAPPTSASDRR